MNNKTIKTKYYANNGVVLFTPESYFYYMPQVAVVMDTKTHVITIFWPDKADALLNVLRNAEFVLTYDGECNDVQSRT